MSEEKGRERVLISKKMEMWVRRRRRRRHKDFRERRKRWGSREIKRRKQRM